ncbi:UDP-N-acetylglucosamine acyltransferase [Amycolatopsis arida]|uniref:UDP-N-acetylglucosamine acyltransferase n=1 Tax=Amycolatopsis arida TaxID=587909 RepID=A0A1I5L9T0_9PSEU|nr:UDP-N-acetylglucosamine acyltransferase [Amycolatopsis arida]SFO94040.1 UDP-N-acetylglucosamine acyltransferase [Amycolatopsis arida]
MVRIHPTAVVSSQANLADSVLVGPYAIIEAQAELAAGVRIGPHAVVRSHVLLAEGVRVDAHSVLGGEPQDLSHQGASTRLEVGRRTVIRESAIVHRATRTDRPTRIGAGCFLMGHSHVGHDCQLGDHVILSHGAVLGGHVTVDAHAVIGGMAGVHQRVRIGRQAMVGGMAKVVRDVLPFSVVDGNPGSHRGLNTVGLRRSGIDMDDYRALRAIFHQLRDKRHPAGTSENGMVAEVTAFLTAPSRRGISPFHVPPSTERAADADR